MPRSETMALFTVVHQFADPKALLADAVFLKIWVKDPGRGRLTRKTAATR